MKLTRREVALMADSSDDNLINGKISFDGGIIAGLYWLRRYESTSNMYFLMRYTYKYNDTSCYIKSYKFTRQKTIISDVKWVDLNEFDPETQFADLLSK